MFDIFKTKIEINNVGLNMEKRRENHNTGFNLLPSSTCTVSCLSCHINFSAICISAYMHVTIALLETWIRFREQVFCCSHFDWRWRLASIILRKWRNINILYTSNLCNTCKLLSMKVGTWCIGYIRMTH